MVLAGIELIFFTLAGIVLCFEISMEKKPVEITHRCLGCCWVALILVKDMSSLPCSAGSTRSWEGRGHS